MPGETPTRRGAAHALIALVAYLAAVAMFAQFAGFGAAARGVTRRAGRPLPLRRPAPADLPRVGMLWTVLVAAAL